MSEAQNTGESSEARKLFKAVLFGLAFGFLLQKGGVAKYHVLIGQLLLQDFTVIKVMLTAIVAGMAGVFLMNQRGAVDLHIKPTRVGANILGGLVFGAGFALIGYCPGTGAAALGQGNYDAVAGMLGLMAGSFFYAELSAFLKRTVEKWGDWGKVMLPEALHIRRTPFIALFAVLVVLALAVLQRSFPR